MFWEPNKESPVKTLRKLQVAAAASALFGLASAANSVNTGVDSASPGSGRDPQRVVDKLESILTITGQQRQFSAPIQDNNVICDLALKHVDDMPARLGCATEQTNTLDVRKTGNKVRRPRTNRIGMDVGVCVTPQGLGEQSRHRDQAGFHDVVLATH